MQRFTVRSSNFPFQNSVGGLYLNAVKEHEMAVKNADIDMEIW